MDKISTFLKTYKTNAAELVDTQLFIVEFLGEEGMRRNEADNVFSPSDCVVNRILDFAKSYEVLKSASAGIVELNLN